MTDMISHEHQFILTLLCAHGGYLAYWLITQKGLRTGGIVDNARHILVRRLAGFGLLGLLPFSALYLLTPLSTLAVGFVSRLQHPALIWVACTCVPILLLTIQAARKKQSLKHQPETRNATWTWSILLMEHVGLAFYLLGYEVLFRGILLFGTLPLLGNAGAIALNIAVYSLAHLPKGSTETLGSIVFGVVLCLATLQTGTIWAAFFIHLCLASSSSFFSLRANPQMRLELL